MNVEDVIEMYEYDYIYSVLTKDLFLESSNLGITNCGKIEVSVCSESIEPEEDYYLEDDGEELIKDYWMELLNKGNRTLAEKYSEEIKILPESLNIICTTWLDEIVNKKVISSYTLEFTIQGDVHSREDIKAMIRSEIDIPFIKIHSNLDNLQNGYYVVAWGENFSYIYYGEDSSKAEFDPDEMDFNTFYKEQGEFYNFRLGSDNSGQQWVDYQSIITLVEGKKSDIHFDLITQIEDENTLEIITEFMSQKDVHEFTVWEV
jgi:hypothetical protein